ncbi:Eco57I restriction-modification methylase domain-containing protein [Thiohalospira halophila]|nr:N-6 DNA methylase [Thiohalospira halophila]
MDVSTPGKSIRELPSSNGQSSEEPMGGFFTRRWIVEWMLDLIGYTQDQPLNDRVLLEPCCGGGAFLLPALERLLAACRRSHYPVVDCEHAFCAMDLHEPSVELTRLSVINRLQEEGLDEREAQRLAASWIEVGDFLLDERSAFADYVIGNPPYVRLENVPEDLQKTYRAKLRTMRGRADLYVGFYERALEALKPEADLGFICADRWMRNSYGAQLRRMITEGPYAVDTIVKLHGVDCFEVDVSAYPAITVMRHGVQEGVAVLDAEEGFGERDVPKAMQSLKTGVASGNFRYGHVERWFGDDVWPEGTPEELERIQLYEQKHEPLQDERGRTRVGIGVATGADGILVTDDPKLVEEERLLPLVMPSHIADGTLRWEPKKYLVNPWNDDGLVDLDEFPRFRQYVEEHKRQLASRHIAKKAPDRWYKTIDRVHPWLAATPKILLADMKAKVTPVVDPGGLYPHHNLYWIISQQWDLDALAGLLLSEQAELFIRSYCVKMRGGTLRMQAQYLRRIRVPSKEKLGQEEIEALRMAYHTYDREEATKIARELYEQ